MIFNFNHGDHSFSPSSILEFEIFVNVFFVNIGEPGIRLRVPIAQSELDYCVGNGQCPFRGQTQSAPTGLRFTAGLCKIPTALGRFVNRPYGICVSPLGCVDFAERVIGRSLRVVHHICLYRFCGRAMCAPTSILPQFRCFHSAAFHNVISP